MTMPRDVRDKLPPTTVAPHSPRCSERPRITPSKKRTTYEAPYEPSAVTIVPFVIRVRIESASRDVAA